MFNRSYTLKKSYSILSQATSSYSAASLDPSQKLKAESLLNSLQEAILKKERQEASRLAHQVEIFFKPYSKKSPLKVLIEFFIAICVAFFIATLIRQLWFELYQIPTGSMRPTYRELDHLIVSKTAFGINAPFTTGSLYFDPSLVQRGGAVIFSSSGLDLPYTDSHYFWLFPYKKRFIKRMIGLPGDTLYFYGGQIYGIDSKGDPLPQLRTHHEMQNLEYIPFRNFLGEVKRKKASLSSFDFWSIFSLAGNELGRGKIGSGRFFDPEIQVNGTWVKEGEGGRYYEQFYGINNYAMARLLDKVEAKRFYNTKEDHELYLEIRHNPNLKDPAPQLVPGPKYGAFLAPTPQVSLIPLGEQEKENLWKALYTTRFTVKDGVAYNYSYEGPLSTTEDNPLFPGIPDGTYEFYNGKGYKVGWGGTLIDLPKEHPLYQHNIANLKRLFNLGIEFSTYFNPTASLQAFYPSRYAYFRNGDLFVMGHKVVEKDSAVMKAFLEAESKKGNKGFTDHKEPTVEMIRTYGLKVPEKHYFVLGDNHAVSGDSRVFGFVPEENLEGVPTLILWPFGERWGFANHQNYPWVTVSNLTIWGLAALSCLVYWQWGRYRMSRRIFIKKD